MTHDVVNVTRFSSEAPGAAEHSWSGLDHLLSQVLIGYRKTVGRLHWTLRHLKLRLQTHPLRGAAPGLLRIQTPLLQQVSALHANG